MNIPQEPGKINAAKSTFSTTVPSLNSKDHISSKNFPTSLTKQPSNTLRNRMKVNPRLNSGDLLRNPFPHQVYNPIPPYMVRPNYYPPQRRFPRPNYSHNIGAPRQYPSQNSPQNGGTPRAFAGPRFLPNIRGCNYYQSRGWHHSSL